MNRKQITIVTLNKVSKYKWGVSLHFHSSVMEEGIYGCLLEMIHMEEIDPYVKLL